MSRHAQETGYTSSGPINMGSNRITNLAPGSSGNDVVNKDQLDMAMPCGAVISFAGSTGFDAATWVPCDGRALSRTTYNKLFSAIGTTHGAGDGSTTFNVPDLRGLFIVGAGQGSGLTNRALGSKGGAEAVALTDPNQLPSHTHTGTTDNGGVGHTHTVVGNTGSDGAHTHTGTAAKGNENNVDEKTGHYHLNNFLTQPAGDHTHNIKSNGGAAYGPNNCAWYETNDGYGVSGVIESSGSHQHWIYSNTDNNSLPHQHPVSTSTQTPSAHTHTISLTSSGASATNHTHTFTTGATGASATHPNMPPFYALTYIIKVV